MDLCLPLCFFYVCVCCFCIKNGKSESAGSLICIIFAPGNKQLQYFNLKDNDETNYNNRMCNHADG